MRGARGLGRSSPSLLGARRPGGARRASCAGDEGPPAPPARNAAAAGRLHCLTTAGAESQPDPQSQGPLSLEDTSVFLRISKGAWSAASAGRATLGGRGAHCPGRLLSDVPEVGCRRLFGGACRGPGPARASRPLLHGTLPCAALSLRVRRTRPLHLRKVPRA